MRLAALVFLVPTIAFADVTLPKLSTPPTSNELQILRARRLDLAAKTYAQALTRLKAGMGTVEETFLWSQRWRDAERGTGDARTADQRALDRAKLIEGLVRERVASGTMPTIAADEALWWRAQAELDAAAAR